MKLSSSLGQKRQITSTSFPLTKEQIRQITPSVFAEKPSTVCSHNYTYLPTSVILQALENEGFVPFFSAESRTRNPDKEGYTKHLLRFRRIRDLHKSEVPEVLFLNSHDRSSSGHLMAGIFRFVCTNSLVAGELIEEVRVPHRGNILDNVIEGVYRIVEEFEQVETYRDTLKAIPLQPAEILDFGLQALALKWSTGAPISVKQIVTPRRFEDTSPDLWTVFNVVQENLVKGGIPGITASRKTNRPRKMTTRPIRSIDTNVDLNRALWSLADQFARTH